MSETVQHAHDASRRELSWLAALGLVLAVLALLAAIVSGPGTAQGLWGIGTGFNILRYASYTAVGAGLIGLIGAALAWRRGARARMAQGVAAALLAAILTVWGISLRSQTAGAPRIHDVTTDLADPPQFAVIPPRDYGDQRPYTHEEWLEQHRAGYGDLTSLRLDLAVAPATERAERVAREMGWEIAVADPAQGRVEATDTTFWFRFKDDIVIRIRPEGSGSVLDVRSVSRVGRGDAGTNARRIREFLSRFRAAD